MKLIYFGTSVFALPALQVLAPHVALVVSQPDRPSGRGLKLNPSPVKSLALNLGIPVETPEKCRTPEFIESIQGLNADALVVAAYGQILPTKLLEAATFGALNLHGSILPYYRGAAPIQRAILNGDQETGVTLMQMDKGMDTGDILSIATTIVLPDETYGELQGRLSMIAADLAAADIPRVLSEELAPKPQDNDKATYAPKVEKAEAELHFENSVEVEYNKFRAFTPSPGAFIQTRFGTLKVHEMKRDSRSGNPREVLQAGNSLSIGWKGGSLEWITIQPEGKPRMSGSAWANGVRLKPGDFV